VRRADSDRAEAAVLKKAFMKLPQGVPMQLAPLVVELNERPAPLPIGVTFRK
jgi:hypothetical protein